MRDCKKAWLHILLQSVRVEKIHSCKVPHLLEEAERNNADAVEVYNATISAYQRSKLWEPALDLFFRMDEMNLSGGDDDNMSEHSFSWLGNMWDSRFCAQNSPKLNAGFPALGDAEDIIFGGKFNGLFHAFSLNISVYTPKSSNISRNRIMGIFLFDQFFLCLTSKTMQHCRSLLRCCSKVGLEAQVLRRFVMLKKKQLDETIPV